MSKQEVFRVDGLDDVWFVVNNDQQFIEDGYQYSVWVEVVNGHFCTGLGQTCEEATRAALLDMAQRLASMQKAIFDEYARRLSRESQHS